MDLEGFAYYSQQLRMIKEERETESQSLQFIVSLVDTLSTSGVSVGEDDTGRVEEMKRVWSECEGYMHQVSEFVYTQTPIKAQGLKESMEVRLTEIQCVMHVHVSFYIFFIFFIKLLIFLGV